MFPNAVNSLDRFHLIQEFNRRLERIRIDAMNRVKPNPNFKETNHSSSEITKHREMEKQYYVLKKFNWLLLKNDNKISDLNMEKKSDTYTAKDSPNELIREFKSSSIPVMNEFWDTMVRWKNEIINSFIKVNPEKTKRINNGIIENRNKTIKNIKHNSNGCRNWERFRNRVM